MAFKRFYRTFKAGGDVQRDTKKNIYENEIYDPLIERLFSIVVIDDLERITKGKIYYESIP